MFNLPIFGLFLEAVYPVAQLCIMCKIAYNSLNVDPKIESEVCL